MIGTMIDVAKVLFADIIAQVKAFVGVVRGVVDLIGGIIEGDWRRAWDGFLKIVESVVNLALSFVQRFVDATILGVNVVIEGLSNLGGAVEDVTDALNPFGGGLDLTLEKLKPVTLELDLTADRFEGVGSTSSVASGMLRCDGRDCGRGCRCCVKCRRPSREPRLAGTRRSAGNRHPKPGGRANTDRLQSIGCERAATGRRARSVGASSAGTG